MSMFNFSTRRVGGIRFIKLGRINISLSISHEFKPIGMKKPRAITPREVPASRFRLGTDGQFVLGFMEEDM